MRSATTRESQKRTPSPVVEGPLANVLLCHLEKYYPIGVEEHEDVIMEGEKQ